MAKEHKDYTIGILIGVIVAIVIIFGVYISINKTNTSTKTELTGEDFKILSVKWNDYSTEYDSSTEHYEYTTQRLDWNLICSPSNLESIRDTLGTVDYTLVTQQNEDLVCRFIVNGEEQEKNTSSGGWVFEKGTKSIKMGLNGLFPDIDNNLIICCRDYWEENKNEICKPITLPTKCS
ncbi:MAG: hypothetical protein AABX28_03505 [Nanoarchaeota archaeon]